MVVLFVLCLVFKLFVLLAPYVCFHIFSLGFMYLGGQLLGK